MKMLNLFLLALVLALTFASPQGWGSAQGEEQRSQRTVRYRITLDIRPVPTMPGPDQAAGATEGEVALAIPGMPVPTMARTDRGEPVNRHLEVAVFDGVTGARLTRSMPQITITNRKSGRTRELRSVMAMYDVRKGQGDLHFGDNLHLADGTYRIAVTVGGERAVFKKVAVGRP